MAWTKRLHTKQGVGASSGSKLTAESVDSEVCEFSLRFHGAAKLPILRLEPRRSFWNSVLDIAIDLHPKDVCRCFRVGRGRAPLCAAMLLLVAGMARPGKTNAMGKRRGHLPVPCECHLAERKT